ncbi:hypothetical protein BSR29_05120 [Boudabousia liubingyangii]|uniref:ESAT-6-like protein n=1 Tax=Boudabousia liubingyangii TaxID=1921764 RepID=A0A1Q5PLF4_9ACTO|nr:WXG100 family type VII secretion target [Boudabousia liubingyangii]OKL47873.1 hypothetical protein BSR29_05120 [Boudabousia liubingyangii]
MSAFNVDSAQISAASSATSAAGAQIRAEVQSIIAQLQSLQNNWQGAAQVAFAQSVSQWQAVHAQVDQALEDLSKRMMLAAQTYADAESQAHSLFSF